VVSAIAFVCVVAVFIDRLRRSAWGLVLSAARENAPAVQSTGISPAHLTVVALASGAAIASTGGALFTASVRAVTPETFGLDLVFLAIFMPIIGGRGSAWGAPLGALIVVGVSLNMPGQCRPDRRTRRLGGAANAELFTDDGWIRLGDIVEVDDSDRLRVVGRLADLIIRGGKNISALEVEDFIREHPAVEMVAAVGVPDPLFGERLCAAVTLAPGTDQLSLADLNAWLRAQGITREYLPERLRVLASMPLAPGGKVAKAQVEQLVETSAGDDDDGRRNQR
jgi:acyl-CoA synthetase (AMP-forming)/AMP-acid ligase II